MEWNNNLKKMNAGDVLDYSIQLYKSNFKKIALVTLILDVPFVFIYNLMSTGVLNKLTGIVEDPTYFTDDPSKIIAYYVILLGAFAIYGVFAVTIKPVVDGVITKLVYFDVVYKVKLNLKDTVKECFGRFPSLFASKILYYLIILGISLGLYIVFIIATIVFSIIFIPLGIGFSSIEGAGLIVGIITAALVLVIFLFVLGAAGLFLSYFVGKYRLNIPAIIIEKQGATDAISRCGVLAKQQFKYIAFTYAFGTLLITSVIGILPIASQAIFELYSGAFLVASVAIQILQTFIMPYLTIVSTLMYIDLRIKQESLDLELRVDELIALTQKETEVI